MNCNLMFTSSCRLFSFINFTRGFGSLAIPNRTDTILSFRRRVALGNTHWVYACILLLVLRFLRIQSTNFKFLRNQINEKNMADDLSRFQTEINISDTYFAFILLQKQKNVITHNVGYLTICLSLVQHVGYVVINSKMHNSDSECARGTQAS